MGNQELHLVNLELSSSSCVKWHSFGKWRIILYVALVEYVVQMVDFYSAQALTMPSQTLQNFKFTKLHQVACLVQ